jgi:hypothetical protein
MTAFAGRDHGFFAGKRVAIADYGDSTGIGPIAQLNL